MLQLKIIVTDMQVDYSYRNKTKINGCKLFLLKKKDSTSRKTPIVYCSFSSRLMWLLLEWYFSAGTAVFFRQEQLTSISFCCILVKVNYLHIC
jgi:hypothetical protein